MSDPILEAHQILPRFFLLTAKGFSPISIRDQMVRAQWLVERAWTTGALSKGAKVLVVGAGAAGATAAITAGQHRLDTTLIELTAHSFGRQAGCPTRWVDPMQYDWPADQWGGRHYSGHSAVPLHWDADWAYRLALRWRATLRYAVTTLPLQVHFFAWITNVIPIGSAAAPNELEVHFNRLPPIRFHVLIWAAGFGKETCTIIDQRHGTGHRKYTGPNFWARDSLEKRGCGSLASQPQVVILGGGDGGVQDSLRALTKESSARAIYDKLRIPDSVAHLIRNAEDRAHRHWIWAGTNGQHDHDLYHALEQEHAVAVAEALLDQGVRDGLRDLLGENPDDWENVRLVYRCDHLICLYGLNRFLALLLDGYLQRFGKKLLMPGLTVVDVDTTAMPYQLDCVGHPVCYDPVNLALSAPSMAADVIVVRYGLDVSSAVPPIPSTLRLSRLRHSIACDPRA
jgi:hypothetical protein